MSLMSLPNTPQIALPSRSLAVMVRGRASRHPGQTEFAPSRFATKAVVPHSGDSFLINLPVANASRRTRRVVRHIQMPDFSPYAARLAKE